MDNKETGISIILFGLVFFVFGLLLLDSGLLCASNIIIVCGLFLLFRGNFINLYAPGDFNGVLLFVLGVTFVFMKFSLFGFLFEIVGLFLILKSKMGNLKTKVVSLASKQLFRL